MKLQVYVYFALLSFFQKNFKTFFEFFDLFIH